MASSGGGAERSRLGCSGARRPAHHVPRDDYLISSRHFCAGRGDNLETGEGASRGPRAPLRPRGDSSPGNDGTRGLLFDFESVRTASGPSSRTTGIKIGRETTNFLVSRRRAATWACGRGPNAGRRNCRRRASARAAGTACRVLIHLHRMIMRTPPSAFPLHRTARTGAGARSGGGGGRGGSNVVDTGGAPSGPRCLLGAGRRRGRVSLQA